MKRRKATARRSQSVRKLPGGTLPAKFARKLLAQRARRREEQKRERAVRARRKFHPRKSDRGKVVFIGTQGERSPTKKGRKGYPVYVTRTGKKWLIKQHGKEPFKARTISELVLPERANFRRAGKAFQSARLVRIGRRKTVVRKSGAVTTGGVWDFNETVVRRIARSIHGALSGQRSRRVFLIKFAVLVRLPSGQTQTIFGEVPIERPDQIAIRLAGILNFVRQKFYSFMARELAFAGYVSNGSANHIRRLSDNQDVEDREEWVDRRGELWSGRNKEQVEILKIEWTIEQAK